MSKKFENVWEKKFYRAWGDMKHRCSAPNCHAHKNYIDKGIKVCDRWQSFENFKEDMYESFVKHIEEYGMRQTTLDRIDSNGNYEPSNCRWSTFKEQRLNTSNKAVFVITNLATGEERTTNNLTQFCKDNGFSRSGALAVLAGQREYHKGHFFKRITPKENTSNKKDIDKSKQA